MLNQTFSELHKKTRIDSEVTVHAHIPINTFTELEKHLLKLCHFMKTLQLT